MTDQPPTPPPLDLAALKSDAEAGFNTDPRFPDGGFGIYLNTTMLALIARVELLDGDRDHWRSEIGRLTRERDEWESNATEESARAEAAEAKIAAVRELRNVWFRELENADHLVLLEGVIDATDAALDGTA